MHASIHIFIYFENLQQSLLKATMLV